jgi:flagellar assembly factor FliW
VPVLESASLGTVEYAENDLIHFPLGLPGFEDQRIFLPISRPGEAPLLYLHSAISSDLFFLAIPVELVDPNYEVKLLEEYRAVLGLNDVAGPATDLLCLAVLCVPDEGPATANLLGPIVIHQTNRIGVQAIRDDARYSARHELFR